MSTFVYDTFTDTAGTGVKVHTPDIGANWAYGANLTGSSFLIDATGQRIRSNYGSTQSYFYTTTAAPADGSYAEIQYDVVTAVDNIGVVVRATASSGYQVLILPTSLSLRKLVSSTFSANLTLDGGATTVAISNAAGSSHTVRVSATGTGTSVVVKIFFDGTQVATYTDTAADRITALGSVGFTGFGAYNESTGMHIASIVGDAPAPAATSYTVNGPTSVVMGQASSSFTASANGDTTASVTVSDNGAGGTFSPSATFAANAGSFKYTPATTGSITLSFTNNGSLANPANITLTSVSTPTGTITQQPAPSGQDQRFVGTTTNATSGSASLTSTSGGANVGPVPFSVTNNAFDFTISGITPGTYSPTLTVTGPGGTASVTGTSSFTIMGVDGGGNVIQPASAAPVMVGSLAISGVTSSGFTATWSAATDDVAVTGYEYSIDGGATYADLGSASQTTKTFTGLAASTTYQVMVRAYDADANRATPISAMATTLASADTTAPTMNGALTVSATTSSGFTVNWLAASDNVGVASYELSINGGTSYASVGNVLTSTQTGLADATSYQVRVRAVDISGNKSAPLSVVATTDALPVVITPDTTPPVMVGSLTVTGITDTGFTLSWQAATDNIGVIGYELSINGATYAALGNVLTTTTTGLQASTSYDLRLRAMDAAGNRATPLATTVTTASPAGAGALTGSYAAPSTHPRMVKVSIDPVPAVAGISSLVPSNGKPTATQDTSAVLDYVFDWSQYLAATGDNISSVSFSVSTGEVSAYDYGPTAALVWFKGGSVGTVAKVVCRIRTSNVPSRVDERSIYIKIKDM